MSSLDTVIRGGRVVRPRQSEQNADIGILNGRIALIAAPGTDVSAREVIDASGLHVMPGAVDPHAHIGLGGGTDEYNPDTGAAVLGGTTTVYYILIHAGEYLDEVARHHSIARDNAWTDYGFHVTLMTDEHLGELRELDHQWSIRSYKYYMSFRGDEGAYLGVEGTDDGQLDAVLRAVAEISGVLAIHPENIEIVWRLRDGLRRAERDDLKAWHECRPPFTEAEAIYRAAYLAANVGCSVYFVHCSGREAIAAVRNSRLLFGTDAYAETCPHFLTHNLDNTYGSIGKVNPPLRPVDDNIALWDAIKDGTLDTVGSDHVGRRREMKSGSIWEASAGFPGLPTTLPVLLSEGYHKNGVPLSRIVEVTSSTPARIFGCADRKGDIQVGMDADLALVDLEWERKATSDWLGTWSDYSLYEEWPLKGWPRYTLLRGRTVQRDGLLIDGPSGQYLGRRR